MGKISDKFRKNKMLSLSLQDWTIRMSNSKNPDDIAAVFKRYYPLLQTEREYWDGLEFFDKVEFIEFKKSFLLDYKQDYKGKQLKFKGVCAPVLLTKISKEAKGNLKKEDKFIKRAIKLTNQNKIND